MTDGIIRFRRDPTDESLVVSEGTQEVFRLSMTDTMKLYSFLGYSLSRRYRVPDGLASIQQPENQVNPPERSGAGNGEARPDKRDEGIPPGGGIHSKGGAAAKIEVARYDLVPNRADVGNIGIFSSAPSGESTIEGRGETVHPFTPKWSNGSEEKSCIRCGKAREDKEAHGIT